MSEWVEGQVVDARYRLLDKLGRGGMGCVWRAEHIESGAEVAVKLLDPAIAENEEMLARFLREARAAALLESRFVVRVFDHGLHGAGAFLVMELLHGHTLRERIERAGALGTEETVGFMCQVMRAIAVAHQQGIVHRDLKPDNIFITSDDQGLHVKLLDFGVAKVSGSKIERVDGVKTQPGVMLGTPYYMSPEQAKGLGVDHRTDIWALAVITFQCLIGKRPFTGDSFADLLVKICSGDIPIPSAFAPVPTGFDDWFARGTERDRELRFQSADEMADELLRLESGRLTQGLEGTRSSHVGTPVRQLVEISPRPRFGSFKLFALAILVAAAAGATLALALPPKTEAAAKARPAEAREAAPPPPRGASPARPIPAEAAALTGEAAPSPQPGL